MELSRVKVVVFDVGNVLVRVNWGEFGCYLRNCGLSFSNECEFREIVPIFAYERGDISTEQFFDSLQRKSLNGFEVDEAKHVWLRMLSPDAEAISLARKISKKYPVGILSNIGEMQWEYLAAQVDFSSFSEWVLPSYKYGLLKPEVEIYRKAENMAGASGQEILFFDDRDENVEGAMELGWQVLKYTKPQDIREKFAPSL